MSTTPDPTPVVPAPVNPTPVVPAPVNPTPVVPAPVVPAPVDPAPVDPALDASAADPTPVDVAPGAGTIPGPRTTEDKPHFSASATAAEMRQADLRVLYAAAGATEALVGAVRGSLTETQRWAAARLAELRFRRTELARQTEEMRLRAEGLPEEVKAVPEVALGRVADLQEQASSRYGDLADRGQRVLADVRTDVVNRIDPAFDRLQSRVDAARRALRGAAPAAPVTAPVPTPATDEPLVEEVLLVEEVVVVDTAADPTEDRPPER